MINILFSVQGSDILPQLVSFMEHFNVTIGLFTCIHFVKCTHVELFNLNTDNKTIIKSILLRSQNTHPGG